MLKKRNVVFVITIVAAAALVAVAVQQEGSDRQGRIMTDYEKPTSEDLRQRLTPLQYEVTQNDRTEIAFQNQYWDNHEPGIYVDVVSGEALFSSFDKFDSGSGWPSFTRPLEEANIDLREDRNLGVRRVEARSKHADSHLGHVFEDGPEPAGLRYCVNSAALRFISAESLEQEGYGQFVPLFEGPGLRQEEAILAGGCFWGVEDLIRRLPGVLETEAGYTGGSLDNPTYGDIKGGTTDHAEAVKITFDPDRLTYEEVLDYFFRLHDPTTEDRQGNDFGRQYRSAIFYLDDAQRKTAEMVKMRADESGKWPSAVITEIVPAGPFWNAEDYHQGYLVKNPNGYTCHYLRD